MKINLVKRNKQQITLIIRSMLVDIVDSYKRCRVNKAPKFFLQLESSFGDIEICLADDYLIKEYGVRM